MVVVEVEVVVLVEVVLVVVVVPVPFSWIWSIFKYANEPNPVGTANLIVTTPATGVILLIVTELFLLLSVDKTVDSTVVAPATW